MKPSLVTLLVAAGCAAVNVPAPAAREASRTRPGRGDAHGGQRKPVAKQFIFPGPVKVTAERYVDEVDPGRIRTLFDHVSPGKFGFTPDSQRVVFIEPGGLHSIRPDGTGHVLLERGTVGFFRITPDSKYVLTPGAALRRLAVGGGSALDLAPGFTLPAGGNFIVSDDSQWVAFAEPAGGLAVVSIPGGQGVHLDVPLPADARYHSGSGSLHYFTPDATRLVYQRGDHEEVIDRSGEGRRTLDPEDPLLLSFKGALSPDRRWMAVTVPGGELQWNDLETKQTGVIAPSSAQPLDTFFVKFLADSSGVLYVTRQVQSHCEVHLFELAHVRDRLLARFDGTDQCFAYPAGAKRVLINEWHPVAPERVPAYPHTLGNLYSVDLETMTVRRLVSTFEHGGDACASSDGRYVVFDTGPRDQGRLWCIEL